MSRTDGPVKFVARVTLIHVVTYFAFGFVASAALGYARLFAMPVIADYYRAFGSVSNAIGPFVQLARGLVFGLALLPFRGVFAEGRTGWLRLWILFLGIGIVGTPAAAPSSIEGVVYTKLPVWFHLIGLPEICLQTLAFSWFVARGERPANGSVAPGPSRFLGALSVACVSFIGYTVVSLAFAFAARAEIASSAADARLLGQFAAPLLVSFVAAFFSDRFALSVRLVGAYALSAISIFLYQHFVLGGANAVYSLIAPILPGVIAFALERAGGRARNRVEVEGRNLPSSGRD